MAQAHPRSTFSAQDPAARRQSLWVALAFFGVIGAVLLGVVLTAQVREAAKVSRLVQAGVRTQARVVRIFAGTCGRSGCEARAHYRFEPATGPFAGRAVDGYDALTFNDWKDDPDYRSAKATGEVPIVYDPAQPSVSALNFRDREFHRDVWGDTVGIVAILLGVIGFFMALVVWVSLRRGKGGVGARPTRRV